MDKQGPTVQHRELYSRSWKNHNRNECVCVCGYTCLCNPHGLQPTRSLIPWKFSRQEYWSGLPFPSPGDLPHPGIKAGSRTLQADALLSEPPGKPDSTGNNIQYPVINHSRNEGVCVCVHMYIFVGGSSGKEHTCQCRRHKFNPWGRERQPTPVFLPGKSHAQRSLAGYNR